MTLATFGAILSFGLQIEEAAEGFYQSAAARTQEPLFGELAAQAGLRGRRMERLRREGVAEMILESIEGLRRDDFRVPVEAVGPPSDCLEQALQLEATRLRFYLAAAEKLPIREVARDLRRLAGENRENIERLRERSSGS